MKHTLDQLHFPWFQNIHLSNAGQSKSHLRKPTFRFHKKQRSAGFERVIILFRQGKSVGILFLSLLQSGYYNTL